MITLREPTAYDMQVIVTTGFLPCCRRRLASLKKYGGETFDIKPGEVWSTSLRGTTYVKFACGHRFKEEATD